MSETMARALTSIDRYASQASGFDGWLFGILRNVLHEAGRAVARQSSEPLPDRPSADAGPLESVVSSDERDVVRKAFGQLTPEEQELLELRVVGRLDAEAVGEVLGKRPGAVRMAQSRAVGRLRVLLGGSI